MRVATYTHPGLVARGSFVATAILALTVALGSSALHSLMIHFAPQLHSVIAGLWLLMYVSALFGLMFNHGINWISWLTRYRILLVIVLLGTIVSVSWSLDAAVSAERVVHLIGCSILAIYLGFMVPLLSILRVTALVLAPIILASMGAAFLLPEVGLEQYEGQIVWRGILNSKNALGFWTAIAVLLYISLWDSANSIGSKLGCLVMAFVSLFVLIMSDSATSLLAMLVAGALSLYIFIAFRFQLGFIRMVVLAIILGSLAAFAITSIDTAELVGRTGDLTGRGEVWRQTWKLIVARPLTGYGYGSIWFPNDATIWMQQSLTDFTWVVYHAHNGFLQVASEIGLPLSCIALLMVVQQLIEIFYCQYERQQVGVLFVLAFVVAYLISNFSEARFLINRELYWIFFIALPISMLRQITVTSPDTASAGVDDSGPFSIGASGKPWLNPHPMGPQPIGIGAAGGAVANAYRIGVDHPIMQEPGASAAHASNMAEPGVASHSQVTQYHHKARPPQFVKPTGKADTSQVDHDNVEDISDYTIDTTHTLDELDFTESPDDTLDNSLSEALLLQQLHDEHVKLSEEPLLTKATLDMPQEVANEDMFDLSNDVELFDRYDKTMDSTFEAFDLEENSNANTEANLVSNTIVDTGAATDFNADIDANANMDTDKITKANLDATTHLDVDVSEDTKSVANNDVKKEPQQSATKKGDDDDWVDISLGDSIRR